MKKALNISIAQTLFTIEEDAYQKLDGYLNSIRAHFAHTEEKDEIISDIEGRISEQLTDSKKKIITLAEVDAVIASMGKIEDFEGGTETGPDQAPRTVIKKKYYRNPDDKVIAGVCSGFGAYTGIDTLWVRIAFVLLVIFTNGFGILLYIILALLIPEAKTSSQRLEMEGTPVTLETMSENLKEKVELVREKHGSKIKEILSWPFLIIKKLVNLFKTYLLPFIRIAFGVLLAVASFGGALALSFFAPLILTNNSTYFDFPVAEIISIPLLFVSVIGIYLALVIPLAALFILALSIIQKKNLISSTLGFTLLFAWGLAVIVGGVAGMTAASKIETYSRTSPLFEKTTKEISLSGDIRNVDISHGINATLIQGDEAKLTVSGRQKDIDGFTAEIKNGTLVIDTKDDPEFCLFCNTGPFDVTLTLPSLESINVEYGSSIEVQEWISENSLKINIGEGSRGKFNIDVPETHVSAHYGSRIELTGTSTISIILTEFGSRVDATEISIENAIVTAGFGSRVILGDIENLEVTEDEGSTVEYPGKPEENESNED